MKYLIEHDKPQEFFSQRSFLKEKYYSTLSFVDYWALAYGELSFIKTCLIHSVFLGSGVTLFCFIPSAGVLFLSSFIMITMFLGHHFKIMESRFNKLTDALKEVDETVDRMKKTVLEIVDQNNTTFEKQIQSEKELRESVEVMVEIKDKITGIAGSVELGLNDIDAIKTRLQACESKQTTQEETLSQQSKDALHDCGDYLDKLGLLSLKGLFSKPDLCEYHDLLRRCELIEKTI